ncbi:MAG TPA: LysM peptidoglycan-binding domain-containing protein [Methylophilaceae bacterium]|nr:LysM peptidoglycan-binding domain-containing protein [Methylophilaceae bacterium]
MKHIWLISFIAVLFAGCTSHVINRSPQTGSTSSPQTSSTSNDWRPNSYSVKKGDTLYGIGLEHGYDYREIAAANNIDAPYSIRVGQKLNFSSLNTKESIDDVKPSTYGNEDGIIVYSVETEEVAQVNSETEPPSKTVSATEPAAIPVLIGPKAIREPYSLEALNRTAPAAPTKVAATPTTKKVGEKETKPVKTAPIEAKPAVVEGVTWSWPTQGRVSSRFNAASNKGINIAGKKGQPIISASAGRVIYAGADLRGYGKLVIIKHSKTLLSVYAHNSKINIKEGQIIKAGQKIAEMGDTGTDKVKLHFEIRQKGKSVDPERFLPKS